MTRLTKWSDIRADVVARHGEEALAEAHERTQAYINEHRVRATCPPTSSTKIEARP